MSIMICPRCKKISHNENDFVNKYCGACHDWVGSEFTVTGEVIDQIIKLTIDEAQSSWGWGESMDIPVLWLRVEKLLRGG